MHEQTTKDNETLTAFWDGVFALSDEEKEQIQSGAVQIRDLAPSEKLYCAIGSLGSKQTVLDYGCGNGWASLAIAESGCQNVTAVDPTKSGVEATKVFSDAFGLSGRIHAIRIPFDWLTTVQDASFDGFLCSNVLDTVPTEVAVEIVKEAARVVRDDAEVLIGLNFYLPKEDAEKRGMTVMDGNAYYLNGVLRLVSKTDEEWTAFFAPYFTVEDLSYFAWQGEEEERRRLFRLKKK